MSCSLSNSGTATESVKALWKKLSDIPVNNADEIEEVFEGFPIGTHREEIWYWFEETYHVSVSDLMFQSNA